MLEGHGDNLEGHGMSLRDRVAGMGPHLSAGGSSGGHPEEDRSPPGCQEGDKPLPGCWRGGGHVDTLRRQLPVRW